MRAKEINNWQAVEAEVLRRIHTRIWAPGEMIPNEQALAEEFGCARATVNRALRALSDTGLLERRRKAGTRVALHPVRKATLDIPMIRQEIEARNQKYSYLRLLLERKTPPPALRARMLSGEEDDFAHVTCVQMADGAPFMFENRWINLTTIPSARSEDFSMISANEWLLTNAPFTHGEIAFSACNANVEIAEILGVEPMAAIFSIDRTTWDKTKAVTTVQQYFQTGYRMQTNL